MLEVNDFNAIRISLASPEQIRGWSYGEVTKPETINYRTLKPEKDGLFCEKIFGPTKDFECYCGKYKRIRHKGIICDKCGVEVARSKVRRERMGHIVLAAPVSHIWFVKGTPSRLGLLLDLSPRSLERILYFAQYIVISVDEEAKRRRVQELRDEVAAQIAQREAAVAERMQELQSQLQEESARLKEREREEGARGDEAQRAAVAGLQEEVRALKERLAGALGQAVTEELGFRGTLLVAPGAALTPFPEEELGRLEQEERSALESRGAEEGERRKALLAATLEERRQSLEAELEQLGQRRDQERHHLTEELEQRVDEIGDLKPMALLSEARFRELRERYSPLFTAGMGAEALLEVVRHLNLEELRERLRQEIHATSGQRRKKATKRLRVLEAFRKSGNKPQWMILTVLPVLPPDLRPMVQLDGGRFATSDLNDLYRRVINRNNRLRRLIELGAPEIIVRNEKRMLQEAVDSLIDNGRRGRAVSGTSNRKLKSLSDMLRGKQGRFRQNLLGKRVDYSGRSVIVVGPELQLHQCGLPKRMALELFKPFVMRRLAERGFAHNIKSAKRIVERVKPEVWDVLEEIIADRPVLLNRAPTLHRLGIQAFQPVLIEGSAIQIHPLVCTAYNADFDGDQMAVHVPLSSQAVVEARTLMLSTYNMLSPSSGEPIVAPTLDMVLGCYYLTLIRPGAKGEGSIFRDFEDARLAYELGIVDLQAGVELRYPAGNGRLHTSVGRVLFNEVLPEPLRFVNEVMDKKALKRVVAECYRFFGNQETARVLDAIKALGFHYATKSGMTIAISDIKVPEEKHEVLHRANEKVAETERQFRRGLITEEERYDTAVKIWTQATEEMDESIARTLDRASSVYMMATSGAKGNISQIRQMAGMRGLMTDPAGRIIDLPICSSFREGLSVLEYFISTHGARKGLADTALRTADSGYLTRRLIDVSQDVVVQSNDCGITAGIWIEDSPDLSLLVAFPERILGRVAASALLHPDSAVALVERNQELTEEVVATLQEAGIKRVHVRSPLTCEVRHGVCQLCYGRSMARGRLVDLGEAVGIVAAQSIGEPGTQLTMRTFHTGGVAGLDITSGLPRVEELFEARVPRGLALISEIDGVVEIQRGEELRKIRVLSTELYRDEYALPSGYELLVTDSQTVEAGAALARRAAPPEAALEGPSQALAPQEVILARIGGTVALEGAHIAILYQEKEEREYPVPPASRIKVQDGQRVMAGEQLTVGSINPQDILRIQGREAVQRYLVEEVQKVYRSQGVNINDKHIEVIVRQMVRKVRVDSPGDTELLPGELVDRFAYEEINAKVLAEGGEPATAQAVLLGVTKASLNTESFLAAASFQETTRVLTEAAVKGAVDRLQGLKENVIIGKLIPAGSGMVARLQRLKRVPAPAGVEVLDNPTEA